MKPTKEELVEIMGLADLLEAKLKDIGMDFEACSAAATSRNVRYELNKICGEEYLETLRNPNNGNN